MVKPYYLRLALPTPLRRSFDYLPPQDIDPTTLIPGIRIQVPFQTRTLVGILIEVTDKTTIARHRLKTIKAILDEVPILPPDVRSLCDWAAAYYHYALGEVLTYALPVLLRKGKTPNIKFPLPASHKTDNAPQLNSAQQLAVDEIVKSKNNFKAFLLDGVTGSGKTEVYLRVIENMLSDDKQCLLLVPEISLTPQTVTHLRSRFSQPIAVLHSGLSDQERLDAWLAAKNGDAKIVIGTRSAIFTPFANLGLIIVDEEHDTSFKQQDRFRYHARDLAIMRASKNDIPVVLGSATPSLESLLNAARDRYIHLSLPERAGAAIMPQYQVVDMRHINIEEGLSSTLLEQMRIHLAANNQVMLFLNRRGFAPVMYCTQCAWIAGCHRCDARMVYHQKPPRLQCHHCDTRATIPTLCQQCKNATLQPVGIGTQRLEVILKKHFPNVPIIRVDRDSTRNKGSMQDLLTRIHDEPTAILLGTQMLAKGHHFPQVTLVGVVDADSGLFSADFRAVEQMGQLLLQVAGRAGRVEKPGTVLVQTNHPAHPLLQSLIQHGYSSFANILLGEREHALLPPYSYFALFRAEAHTEQNASEFLAKIKQLCSTYAAISVAGPLPALLAKRKGLHCQHLLIKADKRSHLQHLLTSLIEKIDNFSLMQPVKWVLDVDPIETV